MSLLTRRRVQRTLDELAREPGGRDLAKTVAVLRGNPDVAIPQLIALVDRKGSTPVMVGLLHALLDDNTLGLYLPALSHPNPVVVRTVQKLLTDAETIALGPMIDCFEDPDAPKRALTEILIAHRDRLRAGPIFRSLSEMPPRSRPALFRLLEQVLAPEHVEDLIALLQVADGALRINVIHVLGRFPTERVRNLLTALLEETEKSVRLAALEVLVRFPMPIDMKGVCALLRDPDITIQSTAVEVLSARRDSKAMGYLLEVMQDESEYSRRAAVEVLNRIGTVDSIRDLVVALKDQDWWVRVRAADALGSIGGRKVVESVLTLLDSEDTFVRRIAVEVLNSNHDDASRPSLERALNDSDWWVRERAIDALGAVGSPESVVPLVKLYERHAETAPHVLGALAEIGDLSAVPAVESMAQSENRLLRKEASRVLAMLRGEMPRQRRGPVQRDMPLEESRSSKVTAHGSSIIQTETLLPPAGSRSRPVGDDADPAESYGGLPKSTGSHVEISDLAPGDMIAERYRVIRHIGRGAFGDVVLVKDETVGEQVILKFLHRHLTGDRGVLNRFVQELRVARRVTHPNVIRIHDFIGIGRSYAMSMEYFDSVALGSLIKKERPTRQHMIRILLDVMAGLEAAHQVGVVHRDIKPGNILINAEAMVKIVDFGLAAATGELGERMTQAGMVLGTPSYMSPEQVRGKQVDTRTDIYSLGVMMYELFAGRTPYKAKEPMAIMYQHVEGKAVPPREHDPTIPESLESMILRCMSVDPDDRYQEVGELSAEMAALAEAEG